MSREHETTPQQRSVRVRLHALDPQAHELTEQSFTRQFSDLPTYERVRQHFRWDYVAIEVWTRQGENWHPDKAHTVYSSMWSGERITDPPEINEQRFEALKQEDIEHRRNGYGGE